jgi:hypothetical protein
MTRAAALAKAEAMATKGRIYDAYVFVALHAFTTEQQAALDAALRDGVPMFYAFHLVAESKAGSQ